jgi:hypothetical protein
MNVSNHLKKIYNNPFLKKYLKKMIGRINLIIIFRFKIIIEIKILITIIFQTVIQKMIKINNNKIKNLKKDLIPKIMIKILKKKIIYLQKIIFKIMINLKKNKIINHSIY